MVSFGKALAILVATLTPAIADRPGKPKQGVFLLSNQLENEVGVYESLDDGALSWVGAYKTGGIGYPEIQEGADNFDSLGSTNPVTYHVWDNKQWVLASNAGGPTGDASISLMELDPTSLALTKKSIAQLDGIYTCSVHAYEDRVCAVTCGGSVTMECFRIQPDTHEMLMEFKYDFGANLPPVEGRPNATSAAYGPGNIMFSGDGLQVGIIMKGDAGLGPNSTYTAPKAGFHTFAVEEEDYGEPSFVTLPDVALPFGFTWRSGEEGTNKQIALVVNIAGESLDYPECGAEDLCRSSVTSILADIDVDDSTITLSIADDLAANQGDLCWIDYRFGHYYTGNFFSDSVTIGTVSRDGKLTVERNSPIGRGTTPNDICHMGRKINGDFYLYSENQGTAEVGVHRVIENDSFQLSVMDGAPYPSGITGDAWIGSHGLAATLLSEEDLFTMYDYDYSDDEESASSTQKLLFSGVACLLVALF